MDDFFMMRNIAGMNHKKIYHVQLKGSWNTPGRCNQ